MTEPDARNLPRSRSPLLTGRQRWFRSQWLVIDQALRETALLAHQTDQSGLDRWVLAGRQRELRAARGLVNWLAGGMPPMSLSEPSPEPAEPDWSPTPIADRPPPGDSPQAIDLALWRSTLFDQAVARLVVDRLVNLTGNPLELDILHPDQRRTLMALVVRRLERGLETTRSAGWRGDRWATERETLLRGWWQDLLADFAGDWVAVDRLGEDWPIVSGDILHRAVNLPDLFDHLLWGLPLAVDGVVAEVGTAAALDRASALLHNLAITLACAVVQPILNRYGDREALKLALFDRRWLPTREVERFRNDLAWKYRVQRWLDDPKAIYESRHWLLTVSDRGIVSLAIYAPRNQEWRNLGGVPLVVTLSIEARDAIAPRVRATALLAGRGVMILLQALGRGIGFVGRGIVQGLGDALDRRGR
ncbi:MAG: DUF3685 domain-containing protein [Oscillatoriales cyanobacterium]|nr:MAG: DUF3685 domain-containing protein [Oscillatoriales cyanobacterium]